MPDGAPLPRGPAVLDEISHRLGELTAYNHEHRHGVNNLSTKFDGLALDVAKRVDGLETKITVRMEEQERRHLTALEHVNTALKAELEAAKLRIVALETERIRREGAVGLMAGVRTWGPWIFSFLTAAYLLGRSLNIIPSPPTTVTKIETPVAVERRDTSRHNPMSTGAAP